MTYPLHFDRRETKATRDIKCVLTFGWCQALSRRQNRRKSRRRRCAADTRRVNPVIGIVISSSHARGWMGRLNNRTIAGQDERPVGTHTSRGFRRCVAVAVRDKRSHKMCCQDDWVKFKVIEDLQSAGQSQRFCGTSSSSFFFFHSDPTVRTWKLFTGKLSTPPPWSRISRTRREEKKWPLL